MGESTSVSGPDFSQGIRVDEIPAEGTLPGRVGDEPVLLSRFGDRLFAVGGACTHYGGNLGDGLATGETVRCPLHHACFDLRTGMPLRAPALDPLDRWLVEVEGDRALVKRKLAAGPPPPAEPRTDVRRIVIVGGGAAGLACANELRRLGYSGELTMLSADADPPCDRPNLSKDFLAGTAPEEWLWLRGDDWYSKNAVDLRLSTEAVRVDSAERTVHCASGEDMGFDRLLIATGSEPNRLMTRGFDKENVFTLRSVADARAIAERAVPGRRAVLIGASFIALEAAAALRNRNVEVVIVSPEQVPLERVFGREIGHALQKLHEANGVRFHLGCVASAFDGRFVSLVSEERLDADFVLVGIGVRPRTVLAQSAGAAIGDGVLVDRFLETSVPGIFAAGDIASYPAPVGGEPVRIEHWVTAERQGQVAAANMLGEKRCFDQLPFFWTEQFGLPVRYVGRAPSWDEIVIEGDAGSRSFLARYFAKGVHCATASVGRDRANLEDELRLEAGIAAAGGGPG